MGHRYSQCPQYQPSFVSLRGQVYRDRRKAEIRNSSPRGTTCRITCGCRRSDSAAAAIGWAFHPVINRGSLVSAHQVLSLHLRSPRSRRSGAFILSCGWWISSVGATLAAGGSRWYRDICTAHHLHRADGLADARSAAVPVAFYFYLSGERSPHLDPDTCGWVNLSLAHTQADLIRAVLGALHSACGQLWR